ncbi:MAG: exodeoxyribonuclease VII small subunit [Pseudomonadota bacterium]
MDEGTQPAVQAQSIDEMTFEQALLALEEIVQQLERGDVPLDQSIELYERGEKLRAACQKRLDSAQERIEKIVQAADGSVSGTAPLDGAR